MFKSPAEIALMQRANDITIAAFRAALATLREGMTQSELGRNIRAAFDALGGPGGSALIGSASTPRFRTAASAAALKRGRRRAHRRRLQGRGLPVGHHAHDRLRQADASGRARSGTSRSAAQNAAFAAAQVGATCEASTPRRAR